MTQSEIDLWLESLASDDDTRMKILEDLMRYASRDGMAPEDRTIVAGAIAKVGARLFQTKAPLRRRKHPSSCFVCGLKKHLGMSCEDALEKVETAAAETVTAPLPVKVEEPKTQLDIAMEHLVGAGRSRS